MKLSTRRVYTAVARRQVASVVDATPRPVKLGLAALLGAVAALVVAGLVYSMLLLAVLRALGERTA